MKKPKVLVVDDEPEIVKAVEIRLKARGYEVLVAMDGVRATSLACNEHPDLIILDIGMPAGDGHVVARRLKENRATVRIPVIFLTARTSEEDFNKAFQEGVAKFITKPYDPAELMEAVEEFIPSPRAKELVRG